MFFTCTVKAQTSFPKSSLIGWWELDDAIHDVSRRDTLTFRFSGESFVPLGTEFFEDGSYKTMTVWAWCGTRSTFEKIFGGNKTKFRKGRWSLITENDNTYLKMRDRKMGSRRFEILEYKNQTLTIRAKK